MRQVFVGLDWAEDHHDVFVEDAIGQRLGGGRLPEGVEGVARFHELVAGHVDDPAEVVVATETDRGLFIGALVAAGYTVLAVNPLSTSRYRERHSTSGAKSDPGDARVRRLRTTSTNAEYWARRNAADHQVVGSWFDALTAAEARTLHALLTRVDRRVRQALDGPASPAARD